MRSAGILAYPPRMYEAITAWVEGQYATWVAFDAAGQVEDGAGPEAEALLARAQRDGGRGKPKTKARKRFKVDLGGLPGSYPREAPFEAITVQVELSLDRRQTGGGWDRGRGLLRVTFSAELPDSIRDYERGLERLRKTVGHELRHVTQAVFESHGLGRGEPGRVVQPESLSGDDAYFLDPQEFFPWLGQSEYEFRRAFPDGGRREFDRFVGNPSPGRETSRFFAALHRHDRGRWRRAVKELWKQVGPKLKLGADELVLGYLVRG